MCLCSCPLLKNFNLKRRAQIIVCPFKNVLIPFLSCMLVFYVKLILRLIILCGVSSTLVSPKGV